MVTDLRAELERIREAHGTAHPSARFRLIKQRLARAEAEAGPVRLTATLAAVEALARSLVVHAPGRPKASAGIRYGQARSVGPLELVQEVLRLHGQPDPAACLGAQTWERFGLADQCRDLAVHECTDVAEAHYPELIEATDKVLESLVEVAGLPRLIPERPAALS
ncbi:MAG TPA: hypothetical protein VFE82_09955 [Ramlibacter sp.]|jgi:hypothetical protein|uniref:hypothetical protein n=1 Tax=Ramlibacter sp. TaxID=1917967 RepID=UPI002D6C0A60|nr:hypothetical protein [Ramlibacter sp.]HZY18796.1 hypothetical protein [Ramlibacter sp.]